MSIIKPGWIQNPFAPKKASISIEVDLQTNQASIKSDTPIPVLTMIQIMLSLAGTFINGLAQQDAMLVKTENNLSPEGNENGKKEDSNDRGN